MSVLIKGLEMPETGYTDVRIFRDGTAVIATETKPYYREFEAVDVPTPHGRLVEFIEAIAKVNEDDGTEEVRVGDVFKAYYEMKNAPTVIEAEE